MSIAVTNRGIRKTSPVLVLSTEADPVYRVGFQLGYSIAHFCLRLGSARVPQPSLRDTTVLRPHQVHLDRSVPVHPRMLEPYHRVTQHILDRRALQRAVQCACSLPLTKRAVTRLLGHGVLAELALLATALLALTALGSPITLDDILRQLASLAMLALEFLLAATIGAFAAEILLSGIAVLQAALSD